MARDGSFGETQRYMAELKRLLASDGLAPDGRARALASLIDAEVLSDSAWRIRQAAEVASGDMAPMLLTAATTFSQKPAGLPSALRAFEESAAALGAQLYRFEDQ